MSKEVKTRIVTGVFVKNSMNVESLENAVDRFLSTRKFISQTSSTTIDRCSNLLITVVVMAEEEIDE